jgi:hypothetical protein
MDTDNHNLPEGFPTEFVDQETGAPDLAGLAKSFTELTAFKAEHDARLETLPKKVEDYTIEFKPPEGFELPDGFEYKIDAKDPRIGPLREFALKHGLSKDSLNDLVALDAQHQAALAQEYDTAFKAELAKLGENGPARLQALQDALAAHLSAEEFTALRPFVDNAAAVAALEKLIAKAGGSGNVAQARQTPKRPADIFYGRKG